MTMARYSVLRSRKSAILVPIVGILSILLMDPFPSSHAISPPHPELLEESRRHRSLHEALFPNVSYTSQPLPEGVWEPASTYKRRLDPDDPVSEECDTCMFGTEICRFLSAAECQEMEDLTIAQAGRTRQYVATGVKRPSDSTTNAAIMNTMSTRQAGGGQQEQQQQQPTTEIRTLVILVAWQDHKSKLKTMSKQQINKLWNGVGTDEDTIPTGSIASYTQTQSHGRVTLIADIVDWQLADNTEKHYADGRSGLPKFESNGPELADAFAYILDQMEIANFDFDKYDADGDGVLDHIQFLHTGYGAEMGGSDCTSSAQMQDRIWSHMMPAGRSQWESKSGKKLGAWSVSSVFAGRCGKEIAPLGVMMHEFYHTLGLPDLYDRDGGLSPGLGGLGAYDMISSPFGAIGDQRKPGSLSPWSKLDIGFASAVEIKTNGTYTIRPSSEYSDYFIIKKGFDDELEYLLIENRNNVGMDAPLWNNGILIYKVDETNGVSGNRRRGFPGMEGWPANGKHYPIALLQADGKYDLEQGNNNGDAGDFFKRPNQKLGPGNGEKVASKEGVYPNTDG
jgi:M6 family metalloprotease-like protein